MKNTMIIVGKGVDNKKVEDFKSSLRKIGCEVDRFNVHYNEYDVEVLNDKSLRGIFLEIGKDVFKGREVLEKIKPLLRKEGALSEESLGEVVRKQVKPVGIGNQSAEELREQKLKEDEMDWN